MTSNDVLKSVDKRNILLYHSDKGNPWGKVEATWLLRHSNWFTIEGMIERRNSCLLYTSVYFFSKNKTELHVVMELSLIHI